MTTTKVLFIQHRDRDQWEWRLSDGEDNALVYSMDFYPTREEAVKNFNMVRAQMAAGSMNLNES